MCIRRNFLRVPNFPCSQLFLKHPVLNFVIAFHANVLLPSQSSMLGSIRLDDSAALENELWFDLRYTDDDNTTSASVSEGCPSNKVLLLAVDFFRILGTLVHSLQKFSKRSAYLTVS